MGRNRGIEFEICSWILTECPHFNLDAIRRSIQYLNLTRNETKSSQVASLFQAVTCVDLTMNSRDDICSNVDSIVRKATSPIRKEFLLHLGVPPSEVSCATVCVYPTKVIECVRQSNFQKSTVPVAALAPGFPRSSRYAEVVKAVRDGADEIDIFIPHDLVLSENWKCLYDDVKALRDRCGTRKMKTVIPAGEDGNLTDVYKASIVAMAAGTDFIKISTGRESYYATSELSTVVLRAIKDYYEKTDYKVGFKPAGGIRRALDVLLLQELIVKELETDEYLLPHLFRIGASGCGLLDEIERYLIRLVPNFRE